MEKQPLVILTGPTAVGKTSLSIRLAKQIGADDLTAVDPYGWSEICSAGKFKVEKTDNRVKITFSFTLLSGGKFEGSYEGAYHRATRR